MMTALMLAQAATTRAAEIESYTLLPSGLIVMTLSVGCVTALLGWCIWRVTRESRPDKLHGQLDVDTHDVE